MIHTTTCCVVVGKLLPGDIHLNRYANYVIVNIRFTDDYVKRLQITVHIDMHVVERRFFLLRRKQRDVSTCIGKQRRSESAVMISTKLINIIGIRYVGDTRRIGDVEICIDEYCVSVLIFFKTTTTVYDSGVGLFMYTNCTYSTWCQHHMLTYGRKS